MMEKKENRYVVTGPMLIANARALLEAGRGFLHAESATEVMLDLEQVQDADSSALGVVFGLLRTAAERGKKLYVANPPAGLLSLAGLYGVAESLPLA